MISAAGHLDHDATAALVRRHFGALERRRNGGERRPAAAATRVVTRSKKELEQVHLCLGTPVLSRQAIPTATACTS